MLFRSEETGGGTVGGFPGGRIGDQRNPGAGKVRRAEAAGEGEPGDARTLRQQLDLVVDLLGRPLVGAAAGQRDHEGKLAIGLVEPGAALDQRRSEEHTSELQSLMRTSYAVFCLKKKKIHNKTHYHDI